jgi:D-alanyl-D-alanine carboxypeptidase/D-alanyl-D-alanine-endopeptidase (penicillin-binding protein 4)
MPGVQRATWGIVVQSLATRERLFELNPRSLLVPASAAKLVAVATAVDAVGWDYRFVTTLRATGPVSDGVLHGDLLVVGAGDPALGGRAGDELSTWVTGLTSAGVHRVDGRIVGVDDAFEEPRPGFGWSWDDLGYATGAIFGALNLAENRMPVVVTPGVAAGAPTSVGVDADTPTDAVINRSVTGAAGSDQLLWPEMRPGDEYLTIAGSIPVGASPAELSVAVGNPTTRVVRALKRRLVAAGVEVGGDAVDGDDLATAVNVEDAQVLYTYRSHPLSAIATAMLKDSINLYGEAVERLNAAGPRPFTNDQALEGMRRRLLAWGVPADGVQLVDGSGLSRRDVLSAETLLVVLERMYDPTLASPWMAALPVAGVDGTLAGRLKGTPAEGNVRAKTGTMSNVRALAGYVKGRDGVPMAFAIILDNFEGAPAQAVAAIDAIAVRLAAYAR